MSDSCFLPRIVQQEIQHWYFFRGEIHSQGGLGAAIISTPDPLDFLESLKGSRTRQGEKLLRYRY